jgi:hypothetical protein
LLGRFGKDGIISSNRVIHAIALVALLAESALREGDPAPNGISPAGFDSTAGGVLGLCRAKTVRPTLGKG